MSLQKLTPYLSHTVWGGAKLKKLKQIATENAQPVGETWEVSSITGYSSVLGDIPLSDLTNLNYLVKFIDTSKNLSIQVHPDDGYAKEHEGSFGKNESWLILDHEPGAVIYLGFKEGITKKEFKLALESGLRVDSFLNKIEVSKGDFFYIPAGSVHAIGEGITLLEVQQSSGLTYRVWDWNRVGLDGKPRELHIDKAFDVLIFGDKHNQKLKKPIKKLLGENAQVFSFKEFADFEISFITLLEGKQMQLSLSEKESLVIIDGKVQSDDVLYDAFESYICLEKALCSFLAINKTTLCLIKEK